MKITLRNKFLKALEDGDIKYKDAAYFIYYTRERTLRAIESSSSEYKMHDMQEFLLWLKNRDTECIKFLCPEQNTTEDLESSAIFLVESIINFHKKHGYLQYWWDKSETDLMQFVFDIIEEEASQRI